MADNLSDFVAPGVELPTALRQLVGAAVVERTRARIWRRIAWVATGLAIGEAIGLVLLAVLR